jgi:hypothetical protein
MDVPKPPRSLPISYIAQCEMHGLKHINTYQDVRHSAGHLNRPALQQLLADIAAGHIDCVVVESLDSMWLPASVSRGLNW